MVRWTARVQVFDGTLNPPSIEYITVFADYADAALEEINKEYLKRRVSDWWVTKLESDGSIE